MRLGEGGFVSTVDTVAALQALVAYSYHSRIKVIFHPEWREIWVFDGKIKCQKKETKKNIALSSIFPEVFGKC